MFGGKSSSKPADGTGKSPGTLKSMQKRLSKSFQMLGRMGPLPIKLVRDAILEKEEAKAIAVFVADIVPDATTSANSPISTTKGTGVSLFHLASQMALLELIKVFLEHQGSPNVLTARMETALHFLFNQSDSPEVRYKILELFFDWKDSETKEVISINRIDADGNSALHKASAVGLSKCVFSLIEKGAIISIVNKSQLTCCELADENGFKELASVLELALMFQPEDEETASFIASQQYQYEGQRSRVLPDCKCIKLDDVFSEFIKEIVEEMLHNFKISSGKNRNSLSFSRLCALLDKYSWDFVKLRLDLSSNPSAVFASSNLPETCIPSPMWDNGPWTNSQGEEKPEPIAVATEAVEIVGEIADESAAVESDNTRSSQQSEPQPEKQQSQIEQPEVASAESTESNDIVCITDISFEEEFLTIEHADAAGSPADEQKVGEPTAIAQDAKILVQNLEAAFTDTNENSNDSNNNINNNDSSVQSAVAVDNPDVCAAVDLIPSESAPADCIRVRLLCQNIRVRIRPKPSVDVAEISYANPGEEFVVSKVPVNGFYEVHMAGGGKAYIQKQLAGVYWEFVDSGLREFVPEPCMICGEDLCPPVRPSVLLVAGDVPNYDQRGIYCSSGHGFCLNCYKLNSTTQIKENGAFFIKCPAFKCNEVIGEEWAPVLLDDVLQERCRSQLCNHVVDCCKYLQRCPHDGCEHIVVLPIQDSNLPKDISIQMQGMFVQNGTCAEGHSFCVACRKEAHAPCSCADSVAWQKRIKDEMKALNIPDPTASAAAGGNSEDVANAMWVAANTKACPRCNALIEKDEGCNHMSCRKCRYEFCWICMQDWTLHNSATGGFFQCNRFIGLDNNSNSSNHNSNGMSDFDMQPMVDEFGNAHAESLRRKKRTQKVARFIHHFTRYNAHGDSQRMEKRMHRDTIGRIITSLVKSAQGDLHWPLEVANPLLSDVSYANSALIKELITTFGGNHSNSTDNDKALSNAVLSTPQGKETDKKKSSLIGALIHSVSKSHTKSKKSNANASLSATVTTATSPNTINNNNGNKEVGGVRLDCISFLNKGFDELIRCRSFLRSTFPFAFYAFMEEDTESYESLQSFLSSTSMQQTPDRDGINSNSKSRVTEGLSYSQRKVLKLRMMARKMEFEQLQTDLEMLTEMLSDVVARRRLRASQTQIEQVTRSARNKRMEFESVLYSWALTDLYTIKDMKEKVSYYPSKSNGFMGHNARRILQLQAQEEQAAIRARTAAAIAAIAASETNNNNNNNGSNNSNSNSNSDNNDSNNNINSNSNSNNEQQAQGRASRSSSLDSSEGDHPIVITGVRTPTTSTASLAARNARLRASLGSGTRSSRSNNRSHSRNLGHGHGQHEQSNNAIRHLSQFAQTRETSLMSFLDATDDDIMQLILLLNAVDDLNSAPALTSAAASAANNAATTNAEVASSSSSSADAAVAGCASAAVAGEEKGSERTLMMDSADETTSPNTPIDADTAAGTADASDANAPSASASAGAGESSATLSAAAAHQARTSRSSRSRHSRNPENNTAIVDWYLREATQREAQRLRSGGSSNHDANILSLEDLTDLNVLRHSQLTAQAEEVAELNRAILMSLRDADPSHHGTNNANNNPSSSTSASYEPAENDVEMLLTMGFERDAAVRALRRFTGDVERAADYLLSS